MEPIVYAVLPRTKTRTFHARTAAVVVGSLALSALLLFGCESLGVTNFGLRIARPSAGPAIPPGDMSLPRLITAADGVVSLQKYCDPELDYKQISPQPFGDWTRRDGDLYCESRLENGNAVRLRMPLHLAATNYEIEADFTHISGDGSLSIDFPTDADRGFTWYLSQRGRSGLSIVDGRYAFDNETGAARQPEAGKRYKIQIHVRRSRQNVAVRSLIDGQVETNWEGDFKRLFNSGGGVLNGEMLFCCDPGGIVRVHDIKLRVLEGAANLSRPPTPPPPAE